MQSCKRTRVPRKRSSSFSAVATVAMLAALSASAGSGPTAFAQSAGKAERKVRHDVKQANLYLKMKLPDRARELLSKTVADEPGRSDPLAWVALGRAHFFERRIDQAGAAVERARSLGLPPFTKRTKWARRFLARFDRHVGALVIDGGRCETLEVEARLAAPMPDKTRKALLDSVPGWRTGTLSRQRGERFFLPAGRYRFGEVRVKVLAGELARMSAAEVGAACPAPPPVVAQRSAPPAGADGVVVAESDREEEEPSWIEDNWVWVLVGALVVAGGAAAAIGVTTNQGPDQVNFNPNPNSFRDD